MKYSEVLSVQYFCTLLGTGSNEKKNYSNNTQINTIMSIQVNENVRHNVKGDFVEIQ